MKKFRDQEGLFTVEGEKMVSEALESSFHVEKIYRTEEIGHEAMARISALSSPSPVLATVRKPEDLILESRAQLLASLIRPHAVKPAGLFLALDTIRDPGNLGTILRIADWFGADAVFASPDTVDVFNPKVVQATMGAIFRVRFHYADIPALAEAAIEAGGHVYGTFLDGENIYRYGFEVNRTEVASMVTERLFIPPYPADDPGSESLNAAVATAVTVAEFRRRASV